MKKSIDLELTAAEKQLLKAKKVTQKHLQTLAADEIVHVLEASPARIKNLHALVEFQRLPSVGIEFARDLILMGYHSLAEVKNKTGPGLLDEYERLIGYRVDPCVEDQFWLAVHYANNPESNKRWWDFTPLRKAEREKAKLNQ